jgi:peptide/nickel transport system permease protein
MARFLLARLASSLVLLLVASTCGYFLAASTLDPRANFEGRSPAPPADAVERTLDELNLNDEVPVWERFSRWAGGVLRGDLGTSITGEPVGPELARRLVVSLRLLLAGALLGVVLGLGIGALSAARHHRLVDHAATLASFVILSTPVFVLAVALKLAALQVNQAVGASLVYYTGDATPGLQGSWWRLAADQVQHLVLPTLAIALGQAAFFSRYQRATALDVATSDHVRAARARGLSRRRALLKHGLPSAVAPVLTLFAYQFGLLITGAAVVEKVFGWHGIGAWFIDSVRTNDVNAVVAVTVLAAVLVLLAGLLADLGHALLDPRLTSDSRQLASVAPVGS